MSQHVTTFHNSFYHSPHKLSATIQLYVLVVCAVCMQTAVLDHMQTAAAASASACRARGDTGAVEEPTQTAAAAAAAAPAAAAAYGQLALH
jgi:hypothetical protein